MTKQVMITLSLIAKYTPCSSGWDSLLKANGGVGADYDKPFALSSVLDSNGLDHTLWCFRALPEHKPILEKFVLFCVKEASVPTDGEVVHNAITVLEKYILKGCATSEELSNAYKGVHDILFSEPCVNNNMIARAGMYAIDVVCTKSLLPPSDTAVHNPITHAACHAAYCSARHASTVSSGGERQKQEEYLRMLLDGEKYGKPEVPKPQPKTGLWLLLTKPFKRQKAKPS